MNGPLGNASKVDAEKANSDDVKIPGNCEQIEYAYRLVRDAILFTNRRLILIDKQGVNGKKVEYLSVPYTSMVRFAVESAGHFDLEAELKLWTSRMSTPIQKTFSKAVNIYEAQALLAAYVGR
ncbi:MULTISPECIES: PH domain-containing protein [unclassified Thiocapsa]|uniref:PH domain-containing protein n=1 Tax=unclassified Thiocapsa TaxID=2641286 RepID=UPI0035B3DDDE